MTVYTAPATAGAVMIKADATAMSSVAATATVTVTAASATKITITTAPPANLEINRSAPVAATVSNDSTNAGVDWTCTPTGSCGNFSPAHTASGASTVYSAPATAGAVTITADATAMSSVTASASVTVNAIATASSLTGTYTFYANGWDAAAAPISVAGSVILDGAGNITGGEQDYFDLNTGNIFTADPITATTGSVTIGDDGRGSITITPTTAPAETLSFTVVNNNHALIIEFDANATTAGSLDLQTAPTSVPSGGNAFALFDVADAFAFGGVVTSNNTSAFTVGEGDDDLQGTANFDFTTLTGSFTAPDASGRGTITLNDPNYTPAFGFAYYVVGPEAFRLIAIDGNTFLAGSMYGQGTTAGAFAASSLGASVLGQEGLGITGLGFYAAAGQFATDPTTLTFSSGVTDINEGDGVPVLAGALTGDTYTVNADGYGSVQLLGGTTDTLANFGVYFADPALNVVDPNNTAGGGGAVMLDLDADTLGSGFVVPQAASATFAGNYAIIKDGVYDTGSGAENFDFVGQVVSGGVSMLTGTVDYNDLFNTGLNPGVTFNATYTPDTTNPGRATSTVTIGTATPVVFNVTSYTASSSLVVDVNTDSSASGAGTVGLGTLQQQQ
ncbi:MAG: hypothetical protein WA734_02540 [Candidatus Acidiferrales bacterium]